MSLPTATRRLERVEQLELVLGERDDQGHFVPLGTGDYLAIRDWVPSQRGMSRKDAAAYYAEQEEQAEARPRADQALRDGLAPRLLLRRSVPLHRGRALGEIDLAAERGDSTLHDSAGLDLEIAPGGHDVAADDAAATDYDVAAQTRACIENIAVVLEEAGAGLDNVVDVTVFLVDMDRDFEAFNSVYGEFFGEIRPTRTTVAVRALPTCNRPVGDGA